jgi:putative transposase
VRFSASQSAAGVFARINMAGIYLCGILPCMFFAPRKQIRLPPDEYLGTAISFVTICCERRISIFQDASRSIVAIEALRRVSQSMQFLVHAFCVMPDHVHFLMEGTAPGSDLVRFVNHWKQQTGFLFRNDLPKGFWQRRFYDHILRSDDNPESVAWYIWMNPVRKGIVAEPHQYPFSGSFIAEWPKASAPAKSWSPPRKTQDNGSLRNA